jgi:hypothetical protein
MTVAPTPEVAAYLAQKEVTEKSRLQLWHRVALALALSLLISVSALVYVGVTAHLIRDTQISNTKVSDQRANCQDQSFNAVLKDARLAFAGDKNPAHYARAPKAC